MSNLLSPYVTDLEATIESLQQKCRQRDRFIAALAHELRNPITALCAAVDMHDMDDQARRQKTFEIVARQVRGLERLVDDAMEVSLLAQDKIELDQHAMDLSWLFGQSLLEQIGPFDAAGVPVKVDLAEERLWVYADRVRLGQALFRLLGHALDSAAGGEVAVALGADAGQASLLVTDTGAGGPAAEFEQPFDHFGAFGGGAGASGTSGLGLAVVGGLIELHGGCVDAYHDGRGASFEVRLPLVSPPQDSDPLPDHSGRRRALIVDDDRVLSSVLASLLEIDGYVVEVAGDSKACLERLDEFTEFDVILCTVELPGELDGHAIARALRVDPRLEQTPLVAMSERDDPQARERSFDCGFDAHLSKPLDLERLHRALSGS